MHFLSSLLVNAGEVAVDALISVFSLFHSLSLRVNDDASDVSTADVSAFTGV